MTSKHSYIKAADVRSDIVEYAGEGNSPEEIAAELGVSAASVRQVLEEADECSTDPS